MGFPIFPWHHGGVPDKNDAVSIDMWLSQNIHSKIKSNHDLTTTNILNWIPYEYQHIANRKFIETIMRSILHNTFSERNYVESTNFTIKHIGTKFNLEFDEEDFITNDDSLILEGSFSDVHKRYFKQNPEVFVYDHNTVDFDTNVANILYMVKSSSLQNIVGFYVGPVITHLISITNLEGPCLFDRMYNKKRKKYRKVSAKHAIHMLRNMIDAIYHLHSKFLLHTNINPSNFHFQRQGTIDLVLIGLESCQTMLPFEHLNDHGDFSKFNVKYLSPARVRQGNSPHVGDYTDLADIWAVGIIAIELLCGISAYGLGATDKEILKTIRSSQFPEIPKLDNKNDLNDLLKGILCTESSRYTARECQEHILFDLKRIANLDVPSFLLNALTCSNIDQYEGILRFAIVTRVNSLPMDIMRQMGSFFGVRPEREITLNNLKEVLCIEEEIENDSEIINKIKKTMMVFERHGNFSLYNMFECICFSQCKHMNRLAFVHDILSNFEGDVITKQQLRKWISVDSEYEIPTFVEESIFKSMNFESITKESVHKTIGEFLMAMVKDFDIESSTDQAFEFASFKAGSIELTDLIDAAIIKSQGLHKFNSTCDYSSDSLS